MKKFALAALLLGLTVGSTCASTLPLMAVAQGEIPADDLATVLKKAAPFFGISELEAHDAHQRGDLIVTQVKPKVYKAEMGGSWVEILLDQEGN